MSESSASLGFFGRLSFCRFRRFPLSLLGSGTPHFCGFLPSGFFRSLPLRLLCLAFGLLSRFSPGLCIRLLLRRFRRFPSRLFCSLTADLRLSAFLRQTSFPFSAS